MQRDYRTLLVDETSEAMIATSPEGLVQFWNRAAASMFGYTSEEAVGRLLTELTVLPARLEGRRQDAVVTTIGIVDTGIGIRKEDQASVFEPFGGVGGHSRSAMESTGLGLHLSPSSLG